MTLLIVQYGARYPLAVHAYVRHAALCVGVWPEVWLGSIVVVHVLARWQLSLVDDRVRALREGIVCTSGMAVLSCWRIFHFQQLHKLRLTYLISLATVPARAE